MSRIIVYQPMIGSVALFMRHVRHNDVNKIAATDGREVHFGPRFFEMPGHHRLGVMLHEYLHAVFAHPMRGARLKRRHGETFDADIFNIAADALINKAIVAQYPTERPGARFPSPVQLPEGGVDLDQIAKQARAIVELTGVGIDTSRFAKLGTLSVEWLYDALMRLKEAAQESCSRSRQKENDSGEKSHGNAPAMSRPANDQGDKSRDEREKLRDQFLEQMTTRKDLRDVVIERLAAMSPGEIDDAIRQAGEKLKTARAMHGNERAGVIERLAGDIPRVDTPWETSFRSITQRHLTRERLRQPIRPGRRILTQEAMKLPDIVWSPGQKRKPAPHAVVVLDSSGSVMPQEYLRYLGEIQAMKRRTNAKVTVIVADAEVQSIMEVKDVRDVANVEFKGRGGTDFRPAIAKAVEMSPDIIIYLTDLMGTFPEEGPGVPVLWTVNSADVPSGYEPPFGRVLLLR